MGKGIKALIISLFIVIIAPIAFIAGCFLTGEGKDISDIKPFTEDEKNTLYTNLLNNAMDKAKENKGLEFTFTEEEINKFIVKLYEDSIKTASQGYIKKMYVENIDSDWKLTAVAGWNFLNTQAAVEMNFKIEDNSTFKIEFNDVSIGRVNFGFLQKYISKYVEKIGFEEKLTSALSAIGLEGAKFVENAITIPLESLVNLFSQKIPTTDDTLKMMIEFFANPTMRNLVNIVSNNKKLGLMLRMQELIDYDLPNRDIRNNFLGTSTTKGDIDTIIEKYENDPTLDISQINNEIRSNNYISEAKDSFADKLATQTNVNDITGWYDKRTSDPFDLGFIYREDLFNYSRNIDFVGKTSLFVNPTSDGKRNISYLTLGGVDYRFSQNKFIMYVPISVNGQIIHLVGILNLNNETYLDDDGNIIFGDKNNIDANVYKLGTKPLPKKSKETLISKILTQFKKGSMFSFTETGALKINLLSCFNEDVAIKIKELVKEKKITIKFTTNLYDDKIYVELVKC